MIFTAIIILEQLTIDPKDCCRWVGLYCKLQNIKHCPTFIIFQLKTDSRLSSEHPFILNVQVHSLLSCVLLGLNPGHQGMALSTEASHSQQESHRTWPRLCSHQSAPSLTPISQADQAKEKPVNSAITAPLPCRPCCLSSLCTNVRNSEIQSQSLCSDEQLHGSCSYVYLSSYPHRFRTQHVLFT